MLGKHRSLCRSKGFLLALVLILYGVHLGWIVHRYFDGNVSGLLMIGSIIKSPQVLYPGIYVRPDGGYDGEFSYYIALDPILSNGIYKMTGADAYRYQRILLPLVSSILSLGIRQWIPLSVVAINLLALILGTYFIMKSCEAFNQPVILGLFYPFSVGTLIPLTRCTNEIFYSSFLIMGLYYYCVKSESLKSALSFSLAVLSKEIALGACAAAVFHDVFYGKNFKNSSVFAIPLCIYLFWKGHVSLHMPSAYSANFFLLPAMKYYPLQGIVGYLVSMFRDLRFGIFLRCIESLALVNILAAAALILYSLRDVSSPFPLLGCFFIVLAHIAESGAPDDFYGIGRHTVELFICLLFLVLFQRKKVYLAPLIVNSLCCLGFILLQASGKMAI